MTIPAGTLVPRDAREFGSYQLIAKLATGGMAEIFLARPTAGPEGELLVLKRILPHLAEDEHFVTMFRDEADLASQLHHKNICTVHGFGEYAGTWFIAMEYLHGVPLSRMMTRLSKAGKMLDVRVVASIIVQACDALQAAHEARGADGSDLHVVHRDVSPPNIMVCADGTVKLLDFGIAKARGANSRTRTGTVKGKNAYMSPEQILGKPLDRRSDVFALATVMYEMLAIKRLFHRDSDFLTFKAITEEPIPDIRDRRPDIPPGMRAALVQAMARDPNGRFTTAAAFGAALRSSVATLGGPASASDLARLLFTDFGDEMATRDEILRAADDPNAAPSTAANRGTTTAQMPALMSADGYPMRPPAPVGGGSSSTLLGGITGGSGASSATPAASMQATAARSGELSQRVGHVSQQFAAVPSMIVHSSSSPIVLPSPSDSGVLDLSRNVTADTWMANPDTDLLHRHRWKSVARGVGAVGAVCVVVLGVYFFVMRGRGSQQAEDAESRAAALVRDAGAASPRQAPIDAPSGLSRDDITSLSRFGFFSIDSAAKTSIWVDGRLIGETPLQRMPLLPGPHKIRAVGPHGKKRELAITIYGGQDTDEGKLTW